MNDEHWIFCYVCLHFLTAVKKVFVKNKALLENLRSFRKILEKKCYYDRIVDYHKN